MTAGRERVVVKPRTKVRIAALEERVRELSLWTAIAVNKLCAAYGHRWVEQPGDGTRWKSRKCSGCGQSEARG